MTTLTKIEIGRRIRDLRFRKGNSQEELGKCLGKSHVAISDMERGRTELSAIDLAKVATFFDVSVETIIGDDQGYNGTFSHHRAERGMSTPAIDKLKKAREEFIKQAKEQTPEQ